MDNLWLAFSLLCLLILPGALVALLFRNLLPKAKWASAASAIGLVVSFILFGVTTDAGQGAKSAAKSDPDVPQEQRPFLNAVETGQNTYAAGKNDIAKGEARPIRSGAICSSLRAGLSIYDWIGTVSTLSTNGDGKGVLGIKIGRNVFVKTWNNAVSDIGDATLLKPGSSIYREAVSLARGRRVRFSGSFRDSSTDCVKESSLPLHGSLTEPEFLVRFSRLNAS
jgi:hypothetical protein